MLPAGSASGRSSRGLGTSSVADGVVLHRRAEAPAGSAAERPAQAAKAAGAGEAAEATAEAIPEAAPAVAPEAALAAGAAGPAGAVEEAALGAAAKAAAGEAAAGQASVEVAETSEPAAAGPVAGPAGTAQEDEDDDPDYDPFAAGKKEDDKAKEAGEEAAGDKAADASQDRRAQARVSHLRPSVLIVLAVPAPTGRAAEDERRPVVPAGRGAMLASALPAALPKVSGVMRPGSSRLRALPLLSDAVLGAGARRCLGEWCLRATCAHLVEGGQWAKVTLDELQAEHEELSSAQAARLMECDRRSSGRLPRGDTANFAEQLNGVGISDDWRVEESPVSWSDFWYVEAQDSTCMVGNRKCVAAAMGSIELGDRLNAFLQYAQGLAAAECSVIAGALVQRRMKTIAALASLNVEQQVAVAVLPESFGGLSAGTPITVRGYPVKDTLAMVCHAIDANCDCARSGQGYPPRLEIMKIAVDMSCRVVPRVTFRELLAAPTIIPRGTSNATASRTALVRGAFEEFHLASEWRDMIEVARGDSIVSALHGRALNCATAVMQLDMNSVIDAVLGRMRDAKSLSRVNPRLSENAARVAARKASLQQVDEAARFVQQVSSRNFDAARCPRGEIERCVQLLHPASAQSEWPSSVCDSAVMPVSRGYRKLNLDRLRQSMNLAVDGCADLTWPRPSSQIGVVSLGRETPGFSSHWKPAFRLGRSRLNCGCGVFSGGQRSRRSGSLLKLAAGRLPGVASAIVHGLSAAASACLKQHKAFDYVDRVSDSLGIRRLSDVVSLLALPLSDKRQNGCFGTSSHPAMSKSFVAGYCASLADAVPDSDAAALGPPELQSLVREYESEFVCLGLLNRRQYSMGGHMLLSGGAGPSLGMLGRNGQEPSSLRRVVGCAVEALRSAAAWHIAGDCDEFLVHGAEHQQLNLSLLPASFGTFGSRVCFLPWHKCTMSPGATGCSQRAGPPRPGGAASFYCEEGELEVRAQAGVLTISGGTAFRPHVRGPDALDQSTDDALRPLRDYLTSRTEACFDCPSVARQRSEGDAARACEDGRPTQLNMAGIVRIVSDIGSSAEYFGNLRSVFVSADLEFAGVDGISVSSEQPRLHSSFEARLPCGPDTATMNCRMGSSLSGLGAVSFVLGSASALNHKCYGRDPDWARESFRLPLLSVPMIESELQSVVKDALMRWASCVSIRYIVQFTASLSHTEDDKLLELLACVRACLSEGGKLKGCDSGLDERGAAAAVRYLRNLMQRVAAAASTKEVDRSWGRVSQLSLGMVADRARRPRRVLMRGLEHIECAQLLMKFECFASMAPSRLEPNISSATRVVVDERVRLYGRVVRAPEIANAAERALRSGPRLKRGVQTLAKLACTDAQDYVQDGVAPHWDPEVVDSLTRSVSTADDHGDAMTSLHMRRIRTRYSALLVEEQENRVARVASTAGAVHLSYMEHTGCAAGDLNGKQHEGASRHVEDTAREAGAEDELEMKRCEDGLRSKLHALFRAREDVAAHAAETKRQVEAAFLDSSLAGRQRPAPSDLDRALRCAAGATAERHRLSMGVPGSKL
ncbi:unnamed protein product [Prorocentrum cordatum]|uniref:RNA-directed RNA polymerase n=1 Tax=Prorocentrum cordatum TaxID=2364126 RepID=A0ABN9X5V9_9DINO|nr:unnamed protein product [Polarella glacialis]